MSVLNAADARPTYIHGPQWTVVTSEIAQILKFVSFKVAGL